MDVRAALTVLGWPTRAKLDLATVGFQLSMGLKPDNVVGPITSAALRQALTQDGMCSKYFRWSEFGCGCGGRSVGCRGIVAIPALRAALDDYREHVIRGPVVIRSGYRCRVHNGDVGGEPMSLHMFGAATDLDPVAKVATVRARNVFSGIGFEGPTHLPMVDRGNVRHGDCRHAVVGLNLGADAGTTTRPALWSYA